VFFEALICTKRALLCSMVQICAKSRLPLIALTAVTTDDGDKGERFGTVPMWRGLEDGWIGRMARQLARHCDDSRFGGR
jgi:hypothetical protein